MANLDPWSYAAKTRNEHAEQVALFMWANMARNFGAEAAANVSSYTVPGFAMKNWGLRGFGSRYDDIRGESVAVMSAYGIEALTWLHAIHNQGNTAGQAGKIHGANAKAEGLKAGVSDIFLPVPMFPGLIASRLIGAPPYAVPETANAFAGLYLELKRKDSGTPSVDQLCFQRDIRAAGYKCEIVHGWELARDEILRYLCIS